MAVMNKKMQVRLDYMATSLSIQKIISSTVNKTDNNNNYFEFVLTC